MEPDLYTDFRAVVLREWEGVLERGDGDGEGGWRLEERLGRERGMLGGWRWRGGRCVVAEMQHNAFLEEGLEGCQGNDKGGVLFNFFLFF